MVLVFDAFLATGATMEVDNRPTSLPEHYERCLGPIVRGWSDERENHNIQVVNFLNQPEQGVITFATLGLSRHILIANHNRETRQELLMSVSSVHCCEKIAGVMLSICELILKRKKALLRGEVIGPGPEIIMGSTVNAVYVTNPSPFGQAIIGFSDEPPPIVFAFLVPITAKEAEKVHRRGWRWFEDELEAQDPNIWDLFRIDEIVEKDSKA